MATIICEKAEASVPKGKELTFLDTIHKFGEIEVVQNENHSPEKNIALEERRTELEHEIQVFERAVQKLSPYMPKKKLLDKIADPRIEMTEKEIDKLLKQKEVLLNQFERFEEAEKIGEKLKEEREILEENLKKLEPFKTLNFNIFEPSISFYVTAFTIKNADKETFKEEVQNLFSEMELFEVHQDDQLMAYIAVIPKEFQESFKKYLETHAEVFSISGFHGTFAEIYKQIKENLEQVQKMMGKNEKLIHQDIEQLKRNVAYYGALIDINAWELQQIHLLDSFEITPKFSKLQFWLDPAHLDEIKRDFHAIDPKIEINLLSISKQEKRVKLRNNPFVRSFEGITKMMGFPESTELDPTPVLTFFFILFFGLALSDAGYGLIMAGLMGYILLKKRLTDGVKGMLTILFWCGISTVIFGALLGSWFGFVPDYYQLASDAGWFKTTINPFIDFLKTAMVIDPTANIPIMLGIMIGLGIIHLFVANLLGFIGKLKHATATEAILDSLVPAFLIVSIVLYAITMALPSVAYLHPAATYFLYAMLILMVIGQGREAGVLKAIPVGILKTFMAAVGLLSETLSYSRLLALGIATGVIAGVIDTLAFLTGGTPIIGPIFVILVLLIGHTINIMLNVLGAYINSARLHFVEFFPKFMNAAGKPLVPFARQQNYLVIVNK